MELLKSSNLIKKCDKPILTAKDIPYHATLIFNAGVTKYQGKYVMVFRNDISNFSQRCSFSHNLGVAVSDDGINWIPDKSPWFTCQDEEVRYAYDPRLTVIDDELFMCFAITTKHGVCGCVSKIEDFSKPPKIISVSPPDNRNMVLFPEKINGLFTRLERPMPVYSRGGKDRFDTWLSQSPDLKFWGNSKLVMGVEDVPYANDKIGPGAPPVKTEKGWLTVFHAVKLDTAREKNGWEPRWQKTYYAGVALLDLENPTKVIGISKEPLIVADQHYEVGYRNDVIFPGGVIVEPGGEVKIYYGAADTVECLARADLNDLISACLN